VAFVIVIMAGVGVLQTFGLRLGLGLGGSQGFFVCFLDRICGGQVVMPSGNFGGGNDLKRRMDCAAAS